jgi:hypothetical protein
VICAPDVEGEGREGCVRFWGAWRGKGRGNGCYEMLGFVGVSKGRSGSGWVSILQSVIPDRWVYSLFLSTVRDSISSHSSQIPGLEIYPSLLYC